VAAQQRPTYRADGDVIVISNNAPASNGRKGGGPLAGLMGGNNGNSNNDLDLLLLSGKPLGEPVAMGGPIVMNTDREIQLAYRQLEDGTFLKQQQGRS